MHRRRLIELSVTASAAIAGSRLLDYVASRPGDYEKILAQEDKAAAIAQMRAQFADNRDYGVTQGFSLLADSYPWLTDARGSIGQFAGTNGSGSCILLDKFGTIALCQHESLASDAFVRFLPAGASKAAIFTVRDFKADAAHDIMFATLNLGRTVPSFLRPVDCGVLPYDGRALNVKAIAVGFPAPTDRLHATEGKVGGLVQTVPTDTGPMLCKFEGDAVAFGGMSGSALLGQTGTTIGMTNAASEPGSRVRSVFTPASLIVAAYVSLYPDRARRSPIGQAIVGDPAPSPACRISAQNFGAPSP